MTGLARFDSGVAVGGVAFESSPPAIVVPSLDDAPVSFDACSSVVVVAAVERFEKADAIDSSAVVLSPVTFEAFRTPTSPTITPVTLP